MITLLVESTHINLEDLGPAFDGVVKSIPPWLAAYIVKETRENWGMSMSPGGVPWAPLAKSTIEARRKRNIAGIQPLIATGAMLASLRYEAGDGEAKVIVDDPATYHQKGTSYIPKREILPDVGSTVALPDKWERDLEDYIVSSVRGVWA